MIHKRVHKAVISGFTNYPDFNNGYSIYEYTENGFLSSCSRFCDSAEKPWWVDKYINNDCGLPIKKECYLMGKYERYDTYDYSDENIIKWSVYNLLDGLKTYTEISYGNGKEVEHRRYSKNGELRLYSFVEYDHLGRKTKIISKSFDGGTSIDVVYEYDDDILAASIDYYSDGKIIRNQYSWEEKDCSVNLLNWFI